jgi:HAD superfamily phosphatase
VSLAVAPPHLQTAEQAAARDIYEQRLREAGADHVLPTTEAILHWEGAAG